MKYLGLIKFTAFIIGYFVSKLCYNMYISINDVHDIFCTSQVNKLPKELKERP